MPQPGQPTYDPPQLLPQPAAQYQPAAQQNSYQTNGAAPLQQQQLPQPLYYYAPQHTITPPPSQLVDLPQQHLMRPVPSCAIL